MIHFLDLECSHEKLNLAVLFHYFGDEMSLPGVKLPRTRMFYLQVEENSWRKAITCASIDTITFRMSYQDFKYNMNSRQMDELRSSLIAYVHKLSGSAVKYIKNLSPYVINTNK